MATVVVACGETSPSDATLPLSDGPFPAAIMGDLTRAEAEARALGVVSGEVIASRLSERRGYQVYEVYIMTGGGGVVGIYVVTDGGQILEVEQEDGRSVPDFRPRGPFISLARAIEIANQARAGRVVRWELELDESGRWKYEIHIASEGGAIYEVEIDAESEALLEVELEWDADRDDWEDRPIRNSTTSASLEDVRSAAERFVAADVTKVELEREDGFSAWKVELRRPLGAEIELRMLDPSLALYRAEGDEGPFDYDLHPGPEILSLSEVVQRTERSAAELEEWRYRRSDGRFVWELRFDDERWRVDAGTGRRLD